MRQMAGNKKQGTSVYGIFIDRLPGSARPQADEHNPPILTLSSGQGHMNSYMKRLNGSVFSTA